VNEPTCEIATIGYENATQGDVIAALKADGVKLVIDIREAPISRKAGFSKRVFAASLDEAGISYLHVRALGTPKAGRDAARRGDKATFHDIFGRHFASDEAQSALLDVMREAQRRPSCLLCYEENPAQCHRSIVADAMAQQGFAIRHLHVAPRFI